MVQLLGQPQSSVLWLCRGNPASTPPGSFDCGWKRILSGHDAITGSLSPAINHQSQLTAILPYASLVIRLVEIE